MPSQHPSSDSQQSQGFGHDFEKTIPPLPDFFQKVNAKHFDGFLEAPVLRWNSRLRASAGRFIPGSRKYFRDLPPVIEIASYLQTEGNAAELIEDTMAHEMIHYWLWIRRRPYGHTGEFWDKMTLMGVSRYNPVPRTRPYRYVYGCRGCATEYKARKRLGVLACAKCCREFANGRYDSRFKLVLLKTLEPNENSAAVPSALPEPGCFGA